MSAFKLLPNVAWLVIACDLPLLDDATLQFLIAQRDESKLATTFQSPFDGLPEPLITIWEPASTSVLQTAAAEGFSCPRKILIRNSDRVKILVPPDADALMNANTPEDAEKVRSILAAKVS
jgi:molybdopterin-guanine dinucleotide biosynthesis protein A